MTKDVRNMIAGTIDVGIAQYDETTDRRTRHEAYGRFQDGDAGALRTDQCLRDVESVLRQQRRQVVAGHTAGNFWKVRANLVAVAISQRPQAAIDLCPPTALGKDVPILRLVRWPNAQTKTVIGQDFQRLDIVDGFAEIGR